MSYGELDPDAFWGEIDSFSWGHEITIKGGRPAVDNLSIVHCLLLLLKTGIGGRDLPTELGANEKTVRRRLKE